MMIAITFQILLMVILVYFGLAFILSAGYYIKSFIVWGV